MEESSSQQTLPHEQNEPHSGSPGFHNHNRRFHRDRRYRSSYDACNPSQMQRYTNYAPSTNDNKYLSSNNQPVDFENGKECETDKVNNDLGNIRGKRHNKTKTFSGKGNSKFKPNLLKAESGIKSKVHTEGYTDASQINEKESSALYMNSCHSNELTLDSENKDAGNSKVTEFSQISQLSADPSSSGYKSNEYKEYKNCAKYNRRGHVSGGKYVRNNSFFSRGIPGHYNALPFHFDDHRICSEQENNQKRNKHQYSHQFEKENFSNREASNNLHTTSNFNKKTDNTYKEMQSKNLYHRHGSSKHHRGNYNRSRYEPFDYINMPSKASMYQSHVNCNSTDLEHPTSDDPNAVELVKRQLEKLPLLDQNSEIGNSEEPFPGSYHKKTGKFTKFKLNNSGAKHYASRQKKDRTYYNNEYKEEDDTTQRERLTHQLHIGEYECMVCCEAVQVKDQIWNCCSCYHVFHLRCIRKWARSPAAVVEDAGWRCPACQNLTKKVPFNYYCFCGKQEGPEINHHYTPHSCGEICGRKRKSQHCPHRCVLLCHPGPCPPCSLRVTRACECGKTKEAVRCGQTSSLTCDSVCDKILNCGVHKCKQVCHPGTCLPCDITLIQKCYCGKNEREVPCSEETSNSNLFSCDLLCGKQLECSHHYCESLCHPGPCGQCRLLPETVTHCPCGKTPLNQLANSEKSSNRQSCTDPIPVCSRKCEKTLYCGSKDNVHRCQSECHPGDCPPCPLVTMVKCRCGSVTKEYKCIDLGTLPELLCEKRCNRRKECGRHKCLNMCCINIEHKCELTCNKKLSCGIHHCQETCHMGNCPVCWNVSFDELTCHCGASVLYPPIPCGTKPPDCNQPCIRIHSCEHEVHHNCHSDETCPPCTVLTEKWCFGHHEQRSNVPCFLSGISCGQLCNKPLPCERHKCQETCHEGPCLKNDVLCSQPCRNPRPECGHFCGIPCHSGACRDSPCKAQVNVICPCGHRSEITTCSDNRKAYRLLSASVLASKMQDIQSGQSVDISDVLGKRNKFNRLECNEECAVIERNKRLAVALQIQNPDLTSKPGPPNYSDFLKSEVKKNPQFVSSVYNKFSELVQVAKQSKQKSRSFSFPPMNRDQRRVIHELAEFFGCETQSYDQEPVRNVLIIAFRDKSWLPFVSIMSVVQRDLGLRKGPTPILSLQRDSKPLASSCSTLSVSEQKDAVDYFDFH